MTSARKIVSLAGMILSLISCTTCKVLDTAAEFSGDIDVVARATSRKLLQNVGSGTFCNPLNNLLCPAGEQAFACCPNAGYPYTQCPVANAGCYIVTPTIEVGTSVDRRGLTCPPRNTVCDLVDSTFLVLFDFVCCPGVCSTNCRSASIPIPLPSTPLPPLPLPTTPVPTSLPGTPARACVNIGFGASTECANIATPFGPGRTNCACGGYVGGSVPSPTVCQANVQCAACIRGCNADANCPAGYNCAGGCGGVRIQTGFNGVCLPNCGTAPAASGC